MLQNQLILLLFLFSFYCYCPQINLSPSNGNNETCGLLAIASCSDIGKVRMLRNQLIGDSRTLLLFLLLLLSSNVLVSKQ